jgi:branched-chain amino acid aminotransferase
VYDAANADEIFLTATSPCILPVSRFNGQPVGKRVWSGAVPVTQRLIDGYVAEVGCGFVPQYLDRLAR